jgi:hypothetical protein
MNPLASGVILTVEATAKCFVRVWVVSPFGGMGGSTTLGLCPGDWPKAVWACTKHPDKTMKAIASRRELSFLFIYDFFNGFLKMNILIVLFPPTINEA